MKPVIAALIARRSASMGITTEAEMRKKIPRK